MWLLIHAGIEVKPCWWKGLLVGFFVLRTGLHVGCMCVFVYGYCWVVGISECLFMTKSDRHSTAHWYLTETFAVGKKICENLSHTPLLFWQNTQKQRSAFCQKRGGVYIKTAFVLRFPNLCVSVLYPWHHNNGIWCCGSTSDGKLKFTRHSENNTFQTTFICKNVVWKHII